VELAPRVRQAVIAAQDLDAVVARLRSELSLGEPFADPAVEYFGLRVAGVRLGVRDPARVQELWNEVVGGLPAGVEFAACLDQPGLFEIVFEGVGAEAAALAVGGVRLPGAVSR
jgi:hypothetical protein